MKFTAAVLALATLVSAQSAADLPSCAVPCLDASVKKVTSCSTTDYSCICKTENFSKVQGDATSCVISKCGADVALNKVLPATQKLCADAGKGGSGSSAPASQKPTETAAPTTAAPTETGKPTESMPAATTDCPTTVATKPSPSGNGTSPATSAPVTAGAAGFAPIGGLAMLALGALAL